MNKLTEIAKNVKTGVEGLTALTFLAGVPASTAVLTGLYLTEGSGLSLGQSSLVGTAVVGGATALAVGVGAIHDHFVNKENADGAEQAKPTVEDNNASYNVYGSLDKKDGNITIINKDKPDNYMVMKAGSADDGDFVKAAMSPTATKSDYQNLLTMAQNYAKNNNLSLKLLDCEQTSENVIADMEVNKDGKTIHIPLSSAQEKAALAAARENKDNSVKITEFSDKPCWQWETHPESKGLVTYSQGDERIEQPNMEKEAPSSTVEVKNNEVNYSGPEM